VSANAEIVGEASRFASSSLRPVQSEPLRLLCGDLRFIPISEFRLNARHGSPRGRDPADVLGALESVGIRTTLLAHASFELFQRVILVQEQPFLDLMFDDTNMVDATAE
jgi:hypothetical protein